MEGAEHDWHPLRVYRQLAPVIGAVFDRVGADFTGWLGGIGRKTRHLKSIRHLNES